MATEKTLALMDLVDQHAPSVRTATNSARLALADLLDDVRMRSRVLHHAYMEAEIAETSPAVRPHLIQYQQKLRALDRLAANLEAELGQVVRCIEQLETCHSRFSANVASEVGITEAN